MKSFFDFLLVFNCELPALNRVPEQELRTQKIQELNWQACLSHSKSGDGLASHLIQQKECGPWRLFLIGEIFTYRNLERQEGVEAFEAFSSDLFNGRAQIETLNGHFLLFAWDGRKREWHVWTNRLGTLHAYYATDGKRAALGTFSPAVTQAASRRYLDWIALTGFFAFGFFPHDRTYFDDVRILRPATHTILNENGQIVSQRRYWNWPHQPEMRRSYSDTVAEFGNTLETILQAQTRTGKIALPISSGLDSRTAAAVMTSDKCQGLDGNGLSKNGWATVRPRLWSYSYGYTDYSSETALAARIAAARGLGFHRYTIPTYLFERLGLVLDSVEGLQGVVSTRQAAICEEVAAHADYLIAAHWGDVWMDDMGLLGREPLDEESVLNHALYKIKNKGRHWLLEHLCRPQLGEEEPESLLREAVGQELKRVAHIEEADFRLKAFKTEQWSFRLTTASLRMFQPGAFPRLPFYDNRIVDFCCTVPTEFVGGRRLQIEYLKHYHPDVARVPWDVTGSSLFHDPKHKSVELSKRVWRKMWRVARRRPHVGRNWEVQFLNEKGRAGLHRWLLRTGLKLHDFVSPASVTKLLDEMFQSPSAENGYAVSSLLTFSSWLERYG